MRRFSLVMMRFFWDLMLAMNASPFWFGRFPSSVVSNDTNARRYTPLRAIVRIGKRRDFSASSAPRPNASESRQQS